MQNQKQNSNIEKLNTKHTTMKITGKTIKTIKGETHYITITNGEKQVHINVRPKKYKEVLEAIKQ